MIYKLSPWRPFIYAAINLAFISTFSPKVPFTLAQRGSVLVSAIGPKVTYPKDLYSSLTILPNSFVKIESFIAPIPSADGHDEKYGV